MLTFILFILLASLLIYKPPRYTPTGKNHIIREGGAADIIERNNKIYACGSFGVIPYYSDED